MYKCDGCGAAIPRQTLRYQVTIDVRAAYDTLEVSLWDLLQDHRRELEELVAQLDKAGTKDLEEQVYKKMVLDLCPECQRKFISSPLRFSADEPTDRAPTDIDTFLRSLGFGNSERE
jgi:hypothetical protein